MGYVGAKLANIFPPEPATRAASKMAGAGGDFLTERARENSPIDTGELKAGWKTKHTVEVRSADRGERVFESGTETDVDYAPYVEYGTGLWGPKHAKYAIRPKQPGGVLHWKTPEGADVFARLVMHPGARGQGMLAAAFSDALVTWPVYLMPQLAEFESEMLEVMEREAARSRALVSGGRF